MATIILVVCGPCGCGKSEVGQNLASFYSTTFLDADAFHPEENVHKMGQGIPLTDQDRVPWLTKVRRELLDEVRKSTADPRNPTDAGGDNNQQIKKTRISAVLGCSALRRMYRDILRGKDDDDRLDMKLIFILLNCSPNVLQQRLQARQGHFMKSSMLESQLQTLELPEEDELQDFVLVNGDLPLNQVVEECYQKLSTMIIV